VGMTRAKRRLYLIHTFRRARFGNQSTSEPSRFLRDIPSRLVKGREVRAPARLSTGSAAGLQHRPAPRSGSFAPGDRVRHAQFGEGIVVASQMRGGDEEVIVAFAGKAGVKRLLAGLAGLQQLSRPD